MIVWLASYPRSGNTLLRTILYRSFGVETFSLYDDDSDIGADPKLAELVGHRTHGMDRDDFVAKARASAERFFVKTHEQPANNEAKAIYLVRDGRAALVSYFHYRKDYSKENVSLEQVVRGQLWGGSWSENVEAWIFSNPPNTLVLRFEDITDCRPATLERIAEFLELPMISRPSIGFSELHTFAPRFFRKGSDASNIAEMDSACTRLFWSLHGRTMVRLGYGMRRESLW